MSKIKVLHTSNLHLGIRFPGYDGATEAMRIDDIDNAFSGLVDYVVENQVHLLLIAGDLFDKMNPRRETIKSVLDAFSLIGKKSPSTKIIITPGKEEILLTKSGELETNLSLFSHMENVRVLGVKNVPESVELELDGAKTIVTSCSMDFFFQPDFKRKKIPTTGEVPGIFILSAQSASTLDLTDEMIRQNVLSHIRECGYGYCALGGRHKLSLLESGDFTAVFPGSLERFDFDRDRDRKCFIIFSIEDGKIRPPETVRSRARSLEYINITCSLTMTLEDMETALSGLGKKGDKDKMLYIVLDGQLQYDLYDVFMNSEKILKLRDKFACVHIENRIILLDGNQRYNFDALKVFTPSEEFRHTMEGEIEEARERGEEVRFLQELLEMGIREIEEGP